MARKFCIFLVLAIQCAGFGVRAAQAPFLFDVLKRPVYRKTWNALLASQKPIPPWITIFSKTYNGVTAPADTVVVDGVTYQAFNVCKPHDCEAYGLEVYFTADGMKAYGAIIDPGFQGLRFLGSPPASVAAALSKALNP